MKRLVPEGTKIMSGKIIIREVRREDNEVLARIIRKVFDEHDAPRTGTVYSDPTTDNLFGLFRDKRSVLFVAEQDGDLLGCCGIYPTPGLDAGYAELVKFYLVENGRGRGLGRKLMEMCFHSAREMGYSKIYLESMPQFSRAVSMYEKLGFRKLDGPLGNSGHTSCDIWMIREL
jgi:putative acetyltransferase